MADLPVGTGTETLTERRGIEAKPAKTVGIGGRLRTATGTIETGLGTGPLPLEILAGVAAGQMGLSRRPLVLVARFQTRFPLTFWEDRVER